jgi:hypothetical protein
VLSEARKKTPRVAVKTPCTGFSDSAIPKAISSVIGVQAKGASESSHRLESIREERVSEDTVLDSRCPRWRTTDTPVKYGYDEEEVRHSSTERSEDTGIQS